MTTSTTIPPPPTYFPHTRPPLPPPTTYYPPHYPYHPPATPINHPYQHHHPYNPHRPHQTYPHPEQHPPQQPIHSLLPPISKRPRQPTQQTPLHKILSLLYINPQLTTYLLPSTQTCGSTTNKVQCQGCRWELYRPEVIEVARGRRFEFVVPNIGYGDGGVSKVKGRLLFVPVRELGGLVAGWMSGDVPFEQLEWVESAKHDDYAVGCADEGSMTHFVQNSQNGELLAMKWSQDASKVYVMWLHHSKSDLGSCHKMELLLLDGKDVLNAVDAFRDRHQRVDGLMNRDYESGPLIIKEFERISVHESGADGEAVETSSGTMSSGSSASGDQCGEGEGPGGNNTGTQQKRKRRKKSARPRRSVLVPETGEFQRFDLGCFDATYGSVCTRHRGKGRVELEEQKSCQKTISGHAMSVKEASSVDLQELRISAVARLIEIAELVQDRQSRKCRQTVKQHNENSENQPARAHTKILGIPAGIDGNHRPLRKASIGYLLQSDNEKAYSPNNVASAPWCNDSKPRANGTQMIFGEGRVRPLMPVSSSYVYSLKSENVALDMNGNRIQKLPTLEEMEESHYTRCWEVRKKERALQLQRLREYARRLRNRETARLSNERRKTRTMEMESELNELRECMARMTRKNKELERTNRELLTKLRRLEANKGLGKRERIYY